MPTADASQFTQIKKYQANINGSLAANPLKFRVPSSFGSYRPSYIIGFLPPNAVVSNKEIAPVAPTSEGAAPPQSQLILINSSNFANGELLEPLTFTSRSEINFIFSVNLGGIITGKFVMLNSGDIIKTIKLTQGNISQLYEENPPNGMSIVYYDLNKTYDIDILNTIDFSNDVYIDVITEQPITSISNIKIS
jgi:hypothetical protein